MQKNWYENRISFVRSLAKGYPFYLVLLPFFFLLHNYNEVFGFITAKQLLYATLVTYLFGGICFLLIFLFLRKLPITALATFFLLLFVLLFAPLHDFLQKNFFPRIIGSYTFIIPVVLVAIVLLVAWFAKRLAALDRFTRYLNFLMLILAAIEVFVLLLYCMKPQAAINCIHPPGHLSKQYTRVTRPDSAKPDIYFLVFDEYTNNSALKKKWNFDNSAITNWLQENGFFVAFNSKANYNFTPFSISSTFNMDYIDPKKWADAFEIRNELQAIGSISNNATFNILKEEQYKIHFFAPFKNELDTIGLQEYGHTGIKQIYNQTLIARLYRDVLWNHPRLSSMFTRLSARFLDSNFRDAGNTPGDLWLTLDRVKATVNSSPDRKPFFVYGHFMITHKPHVFDSTGSLLKKEELNLGNKNLVNTYIRQVQYANKIIRELIEYIKSNNRRNTIIIIEGDHGFKGLPKDGHDPLANFNAFYFPDHNYSHLYDSISPVNTFRVVFNNYFQQHFPLLKDSSAAVKY